MKFKYTGHAPIKDVDLALAGIFKPEEVITTGKIFEIPDENKGLIQRVEVSGIYEPYIEPKKIIERPKKEKQNKEEKELKEEK